VDKGREEKVILWNCFLMNDCDVFQTNFTTFNANSWTCAWTVLNFIIIIIIIIIILLLLLLWFTIF